MKTFLSIDRGSSFTDFAVIASNDEILYTTFLPSRNWNDILATHKKLKNKFSPDEIFLTGSEKNMPAELNDHLHRVKEIDAIAFGGSFLSKKEKCIVVSMGTGTAVALFDSNNVMHISGTGVGGGTVTGLGMLINRTADPVILNHLALKGNPSSCNLTLSEIGYQNVGFLQGDITVSNFGSIKSSKKEDLSAAILNLVGETIGVIASLSAQMYNLKHDIVVIGNLSKSNYLRDTLVNVGELYGTEFSFPDNPEYATAFGAVKSFFYSSP